MNRNKKQRRNEGDLNEKGGILKLKRRIVGEMKQKRSRKRKTEKEVDKGSHENLHRFFPSSPSSITIFCERCLGKCRDVKEEEYLFATMSVEPPVAITVGGIALIGVYCPGHTY
jgi:hypothetical protein